MGRCTDKVDVKVPVFAVLVLGVFLSLALILVLVLAAGRRVAAPFPPLLWFCYFKPFV